MNRTQNSRCSHTDATPYPSSTSLRFQINLIFCCVSMLVLAILVTLEIAAARNGIREEMNASNRIATQLLTRISALYADKGITALADFLNDTGRVRANELRLTDAAGRVLYASPPPRYKSGRNAPGWYASLVTPSSMQQTILLAAGTLTITPNSSRAVLDAWDDLQLIFLLESLVLAAANIMMLLVVSRWLAPLDQIHKALRDIETGKHTVRLPPLRGKEAGEMGRAFNRMAQAVEDNIQVRQFSAETQTRLATQREFTALLHQRIEEERAALARELHDELGQSLTAIRSIAKSMMQHLDGQNHPLEQSARMLFDTAGSTTDALQRMIPRLRPIQLEGMGLVDALRDLIAERQIIDPQLKIDARLEVDIGDLPEHHELSIYRIVQEALTNVQRHANATHVALTLRREVGSTNDMLRLTISDNGNGGTADLRRSGHYGVLGMQERAESLAGHVMFGIGPMGGLQVDVSIPLSKSSLVAQFDAPPGTPILSPKIISA